MTAHVFNPPASMRHQYFQYYPNYCISCTDEEFDEALGLVNAAWFRRAYEVLDGEDLTRITIQGKSLGHWLQKLDERNKQSNGDK